MAGARGLNPPPRGDQRDWSNTGSFINRPERGWLHPDEQLAPDAGVCYGVRYIGSMEVTISMKTLDFETRTAVAKESISRICDAGGLKSPTKKAKKGLKVGRFLGDQPNMRNAGSNVNLTITTDCLMLMVMETGEVIGCNDMPGISFASGGDSDTLDFVAYVAKDADNHRACYVLECGGGLAQDVITTIGQAFEIRFKQYLARKPPVVQNPSIRSDKFKADSWGNEQDYYNDRPGAIPPPDEVGGAYAIPHSNQPVRQANPQSLSEKQRDLIDFGWDDSIYDNKLLENDHRDMNMDEEDTLAVFDPLANGGIIFQEASAASPPFSANFTPKDAPPAYSPTDQIHAAGSPVHEEWYFGSMSRHQAETLLKQDGDFLVRESSHSPGQYVLSGMKHGRVKHLLLVDPSGVIRTRDRVFSSVSHLVTYHMETRLPIISEGSELELKHPISHSAC